MLDFLVAARYEYIIFAVLIIVSDPQHDQQFVVVTTMDWDKLVLTHGIQLVMVWDTNMDL